MSEDTDNTILDTINMFPYPEGASTEEIAKVNRQRLDYLIKQFVKLDGKADIAKTDSKNAMNWIDEEKKLREDNKEEKKDNWKEYRGTVIGIIAAVVILLIAKYCGI